MAQTTPFESTASIEPFYSKENQAHLKRAIAQLESGIGKTHELIEADDE